MVSLEHITVCACLCRVCSFCSSPVALDCPPRAQPRANLDAPSARCHWLLQRRLAWWRIWAWSRAVWLWNLALPLPSCVILDCLRLCSVLPFPHSTHLSKLLWRLNALIHVKYIARCLASSKSTIVSYFCLYNMSQSRFTYLVSPFNES